MKWLKMTMSGRLKKESESRKRHKYSNKAPVAHTSCLGVPRMQFCTEEEKVMSRYSEQLGLKDEDFLTFRWSKFPDGKPGTRAPKDMVREEKGVGRLLFLRFSRVINIIFYPYLTLWTFSKYRCTSGR